LLIAVVLIALRSPHPERLLASFYAGALLTTVTVGLLVVGALQKTSVVTGPSSRQTLDPALSITIGALALISAYMLRQRVIRQERGRDLHMRQEAKTTGPTRWEKMLGRGAPLAFVVGVLLDIFPGFFPFVALKNIAELDYGLGSTAALILGFYLVMFVIIELPLVGYLFMPRRTTEWATRFNRWLDRNGRSLAVYALAGVGGYLAVRGIVMAVT
jgi:Sap, sulfolipid-1-addressing protein